MKDCPWGLSEKRGACREKRLLSDSQGLGSSNADFSVEGAGGMEGTGASGHAQTWLSPGWCGKK